MFHSSSANRCTLPVSRYENAKSRVLDPYRLRHRATGPSAVQASAVRQHSQVCSANLRLAWKLAPSSSERVTYTDVPAYATPCSFAASRSRPSSQTLASRSQPSETSESKRWLVRRLSSLIVMGAE